MAYVGCLNIECLLSKKIPIKSSQKESIMMGS